MTPPTPNAQHAHIPAGQPADDRAAIRATVLDYAQSWYEGDAERMRRSLHPNLAKRSIRRDKETGAFRVNETTYREMVDDTRNGGGSRLPAGQRTYTVTILDIHGDIACARADTYEFVDLPPPGALGGPLSHYERPVRAGNRTHS